MDEHTFQDELRQLKQRVSEMSLSSQQRQMVERQREHLAQAQSVPTYLWPCAPDSFSTQLLSIKSQLESMQRTVAAHVQQRNAWQQASVGPQANIALPPHGGFDGPSTPIYWQLYSSLKSDVQSIDERVANMEDLYSELEDRIDALDPRRFTPPGSESGVEEAVASQVHNVAPVEQRTETELPGDSGAELHPAHSAEPPSSATCPAPGSVSGAIVQLQAQLCHLEQATKNITTDASCSGMANASAGDGPSSSTPAQPPAGVAFRDKEIDRLEELLKRSHDINKINDKTLEFREQEVTQLETRAQNAEHSAHQMVDACRAQASELGRRNDAIQRLSAELRDFKASRHHFMTKYVDENYRYKWLKQKKIQSEDQLQGRIDELEQALADVEDGKIAANNEELEKLQAFCAQKDAVIYRQEEIIARGGKMIQQRDADIVHLEGRLEEMDKERSYLRDEANSLASELKQRNATISQLQREIEYRAARQLELENDRKTDTERLKRASRFIREHVRADEPKRAVQAESFDQAAKAASSGRIANASAAWTPRPIPGYAKLPHEENRALLWGQAAPAPARVSFGSTSPMSLAAKQRRSGPYHRAERRSSPVAMRGANTSEKPSRGQEDESAQSDALHGGDAGSGNDTGDSNFTRRADPVAEQSRMNAQQRAGDRPHKPGRHSLPLDATFWPPLPAPVPAGEGSGRRVESVPNLRGASRAQVQTSNSGAAIAKPASMEQLPRRRLQAYVEEDSGGDERGGSSLLD